MGHVLIVEDEEVLARSIASFLERRGFSASFALDSKSAQTLFEREKPRLVVLDYKIHDKNGLDFLKWARTQDSRTQFVMMTGHGEVDVAVQAMKLGARDFLVKPTPLASIASIAGELMLDEFQVGRNSVGVDRIIGRSAAANTIRNSIQTLARATRADRSGVLIMGPAGAGKNLAAIALHETINARAKIVQFDCGVDNAASLSDAYARANGGTLLLRGLSELKRESQSKLLQLCHGCPNNIRLIATTTKHLVPGDDIIRELLYLIQVGWIDVPPLSDRTSDILPIADHFARDLAQRRGNERPRFTSAARAMLLEHNWPGNVAELENCIERAMLVTEKAEIDVGAIRTISDTRPYSIPTLQEQERTAINKALTQTNGNVSRAAELLGISRDKLRYRMGKFGMSRR